MQTKTRKLFARKLAFPKAVVILGLSTGIAVVGFTSSGTAQVNLGLESQQCVMNGVQRWSRDISVGNELRTSALRISTHPRAGGRRSQMTCNLRSASTRPFTTLQLDLGLPDDEYRAATVFVFLDGNLVRTEQLQPGMSKQLALDVRSSRNVSIEATGESSYGMYPYLYILNATLVQ
ncbi:hypothetical protein [Leptolyngbya ohadii]|uniref:hypothetical protein n=1 Tax=Leptolyngbya ohadii TaxID=1962290 RepID=UPI00117B17E3|nr:hypothetical protein [Leptolyngbya ohadii]